MAHLPDEFVEGGFASATEISDSLCRATGVARYGRVVCVTDEARA